MSNPNIASLTNVATCQRALQLAQSRANGFPGMVTFYGPSGLGKTVAATYAANKFNAIHIECRSVWTTATPLLRAILKEMHIDPAKKPIYEMADMVAKELADSGRCLIVDEFDYLVTKKIIDVIRDIHDASDAAILLIGEENLPTKLRAWERFHNRVLDWFVANPATKDDAAELAKINCQTITVADDLLDDLLITVRGNVRRICTNLDKIKEVAKVKGLKTISLADWKNSGEIFNTGDPAPRRIR